MRVLMKSCVVRTEVLGKPAPQVLRKSLLVIAAIIVNEIHDIAKFVKQHFVISLVLREQWITRITHVLLFECEVGRDLGEYFAEHGYHFLRGRVFTDQRVQIVDQIDHFAMFEIDRRHADTEVIFPFNKAHRKLKPPVSGLNVIVKYRPGCNSTVSVVV